MREENRPREENPRTAGVTAATESRVGRSRATGQPLPDETFRDGWPTSRVPRWTVPGIVADPANPVTFRRQITLDADGRVEGGPLALADVESGRRLTVEVSACRCPYPRAVEALGQARMRGVQVEVEADTEAAIVAWNEALRSSS